MSFALIAGAVQVKTRSMAIAANPEFLDDIRGALDWWREAGVDFDFDDEPHVWIAPEHAEPEVRLTPAQIKEQAAAQAAATVAAEVHLGTTDLPVDLASFRDWWMREPGLDDGAIGGRTPPTGAAGAPYMILIPEPEDGDDEHLLSGPQGRLLDAMLAAFGTRREECYLASVLPRPVPAPDWSALAARGLGRIAAHHVRLAAPERLVVLGANVLPLIGHELPQRSAVLREFNHEGGTVPLLAARSLSALLNMPAGKAQVWRAWLEWTGS